MYSSHRLWPSEKLFFCSALLLWSFQEVDIGVISGKKLKPGFVLEWIAAFLKITQVCVHNKGKVTCATIFLCIGISLSAGAFPMLSIKVSWPVNWLEP